MEYLNLFTPPESENERQSDKSRKMAGGIPEIPPEEQKDPGLWMHSETERDFSNLTAAFMNESDPVSLKCLSPLKNVKNRVDIRVGRFQILKADWAGPMLCKAATFVGVILLLACIAGRPVRGESVLTVKTTGQMEKRSIRSQNDGLKQRGSEFLIHQTKQEHAAEFCDNPNCGSKNRHVLKEQPSGRERNPQSEKRILDKMNLAPAVRFTNLKNSGIRNLSQAVQRIMCSVFDVVKIGQLKEEKLNYPDKGKNKEIQKLDFSLQDQEERRNIDKNIQLRQSELQARIHQEDRDPVSGCFPDRQQSINSENARKKAASQVDSGQSSQEQNPHPIAEGTASLYSGQSKAGDCSFEFQVTYSEQDPDQETLPQMKPAADDAGYVQKQIRGSSGLGSPISEEDASYSGDSAIKIISSFETVPSVFGEKQDRLEWNSSQQNQSHEERDPPEEFWREPAVILEAGGLPAEDNIQPQLNGSGFLQADSPPEQVEDQIPEQKKPSDIAGQRPGSEQPVLMDLSLVKYDFLYSETESFLDQIRKGERFLNYRGNFEEARDSLEELVSGYCSASESVDYFLELDTGEKVVEIAEYCFDWLSEQVRMADQDWKLYLDQIDMFCKYLKTVKNEGERLERINEYICENYSYKVTHKGMPDFVRTKTGQCWHFAKMFVDMAKASGSKAWLQSTAANSWAEVEVDGHTYLFDPAFNATCGTITAYNWQQR